MRLSTSLRSLRSVVASATPARGFSSLAPTAAGGFPGPTAGLSPGTQQYMDRLGPEESVPIRWPRPEAYAGGVAALRGRVPVAPANPAADQLQGRLCYAVRKPAVAAESDGDHRLVFIHCTGFHKESMIPLARHLAAQDPRQTIGQPDFRHLGQALSTPGVFLMPELPGPEPALAEHPAADVSPWRHMLVDLRNHGSSAVLNRALLEAPVADLPTAWPSRGPNRLIPEPSRVADFVDSWAVHALDVIDLLEADRRQNPGAGKTVLVGHSFGGFVSMVIDYLRPDLVDGLVCIEPILVPDLAAPRLGLDDAQVAKLAPTSQALVNGDLGRIVRGLSYGGLEEVAIRRRTDFESPDATMEYFQGKALFREFDADTTRLFATHGTCPIAEGPTSSAISGPDAGMGVTLKCGKTSESSTYHGVHSGIELFPHVKGLTRPMMMLFSTGSNI
ncbi:hypothetical protein H696_05265 [Fonticula alba]|uniref:AB hydrolase-1 domain-containing protein n=1 Tax=Fonticula alba TaxID=691883 RepID=A0A058Z343_FONAL|nr:hypothetical protein H696_05265 [Fonticula alba]KCV68348.1 hypothetical protein H696_05265 [Fonticula alba]|eukprot:XP_009497402.1 hypothetical protein H696_05265 [Fonticula alba]